MKRTLNDQEIATILCALRGMYEVAPPSTHRVCSRECDHFEDTTPLTPSAAETLCEQINLDSVSVEYEAGSSRCATCGQTKSARGGDVHCSGDCDDGFHGERDGCHRFAEEMAQEPPYQVLARLERAIADACDEGTQNAIADRYRVLERELNVSAMAEWSGEPDPCDPDNYWIDDVTKERVSAITGARSPHECSPVGMQEG